MTDTKPEKLTDEELEVALDEVDRRGCETRLKEPLALGRRLRDHIAALEAERQAPLLDLWRALGSQEGPARPDVLVCQARDLRERVRTLEAERDKSRLQGQADHRALHDALGWTHGWHGAVLPPPWRAVTALIAERDEWKQRWQDEDNAARYAREVNQAERQRALDAEARASWLELAAHATIKATQTMQGMSADLAAARLAAQTALEAPKSAVDRRPTNPDATSEIDEPLPAVALPLVVTAADGALAVLEDLKQRHIPPARHGRFEDATALLKRRMGTAEKAIRDMLALWDEEGPIPSGHHDVAMMSLRAALTDTPPAIKTPCDYSGAPGTHEAGAACIADEPRAHEHSSLKQCDPSCPGWPLQSIPPPTPAAAEAFATVRDLSNDHVDDDEARCLIRGHLALLERRMGAMARALSGCRTHLKCTEGCTCDVCVALTDAPPVFTLEASKAGDAAYKAVFRIYGDATRARQVADEVLAALRSAGGGR